MKSLRKAAAQQNPPTLISTKSLARMVNLHAPVSMSQLMNKLSEPVSFSGNVVTPSGTALGGSVNLTIFSDGRFTFKVHMHDSGFDPYTFRVRCALTSPGGVILIFQVSGHVDGTGSNLLGHVNRDFDHTEDGRNPMIAANWIDVRSSSMAVSKSYQDAGALHAIEEIAKDLLGFLVADVTLGAGLALVIAVSAEIANSLDASFIGPGGLVGVAVAGGVVWMFGPSAIIAAVVAGVAAGAITDAMIKHRQLTALEYEFASAVFGDTLPPRERIFVTNLSHGGGRKYTWPELDGSVVLNIDDAFDHPMDFAKPASKYPTRGQVLIHELAHAWQIRTKSFIPGLLCKAVFETGSYEYGLNGQAWSDFGLEQQASIVDQWYGAHAGVFQTPADLVKNLALPAAVHDPRFIYIATNVRFARN